MKISELNQELSNTLYQYMKKEHLDLENQITNEEWEDFINDYQDRFSEETSYIAQEMFREFIIYRNKKWKLQENFI